MNIKEIKQLLNLVSEHELAEFKLEREGTKISIKKYSGVTTVEAPQAIMAAQPAVIPQVTESAPEEVKQVDDANLHSIVSPIVGTFYAAPSPESPAFASVGSKVGKNDTVCIVEAMKVMNEIKAEVSGVIEEVLVENGQAVEFGQVLFKVRK